MQTQNLEDTVDESQLLNDGFEKLKLKRRTIMHKTIHFEIYQFEETEEGRYRYVGRFPSPSQFLMDVWEHNKSEVARR